MLKRPFKFSSIQKMYSLFNFNQKKKLEKINRKSSDQKMFLFFFGAFEQKQEEETSRNVHVCIIILLTA